MEGFPPGQRHSAYMPGYGHNQKKNFWDRDFVVAIIIGGSVGVLAGLISLVM
jgi:hypothetical protein